jgi:hypothetical protein
MQLSFRSNTLITAWPFEIGHFIAQDDPETAHSFRAGIETMIIGQVAIRPASSPAWNDLAPALRIATHGRYLIFFMHGAGRAEVIITRLPPAPRRSSLQIGAW